MVDEMNQIKLLIVDAERRHSDSIPWIAHSRSQRIEAYRRSQEIENVKRFFTRSSKGQLCQL